MLLLWLAQIKTFLLCFRFTATKYGNNKSGSFCFLVDGQRVFSVSRLDKDESMLQGTGTINLQLTAGQKVTVQNRGSNRLHGRNENGAHCWFTGFMLGGL